ncbi:MAG: hypothetical protein RML12_11470 [Xanthomonadales bacterium]|nr:hypothetical protein [Xanthomonadales bacterium]
MPRSGCCSAIFPLRRRVLVLGRASHAELAGRGFAPSWYDPGLAADPRWAAPAEADREPLLEAAWDYGFTHLLLAGHPDPAALAERLRRVGATPAGWRYDAVLWALPLAPDHPRRDLRRERDRARAIRRAWR